MIHDAQCWWPRVHATTLFVKDQEGLVRVVPPEVVVRNYDCCLVVPLASQAHIRQSSQLSLRSQTTPMVDECRQPYVETGWPSLLDPKCVVVLATQATNPRCRRHPDRLRYTCRRRFSSNRNLTYYHWFVRLSTTPNILEKVPPEIISVIVKTLEKASNFSSSCLLTEYPDHGASICMDGWQSEGEYRAQLAKRRALLSVPRPVLQPMNEQQMRQDNVADVADVVDIVTEGTKHLVHDTAKSLCVICCCSTISRVIMPCGHAALCHKCESTHVWSACPICRAAISFTSPVFMCS